MKPETDGFFNSDDGHKVYYSAYGNPNGKKYLFVHGGPGGGTSHAVLEFFNLNDSYVVLVDQRGCGKSLPFGEIKNNTTANLVEDFEAIRKILFIDKWVLFGGSWGSTLSLIYAQTYPQAIEKLILRGIFLGGKAGTDWLSTGNGAARIWPEAWQEFNATVPDLAKQANPCNYLYEKICAGNQDIAIAFAKWEGRISCHQENPALVSVMGNYPVGYTVGKIELHYMVNDFFLEEDQILNNISKIKMPVEIVHGRYDIVCPVDHALILHQNLNISQLHIMPNSGHSAFEPEIFKKLKELT